MKCLAVVLSVLCGSCSMALAQRNPSGVVNPKATIAGDHGQTHDNPSGSGTSPSGGNDANPDHGFTAIPTDKAPHPKKNEK